MRKYLRIAFKGFIIISIKALGFKWSILHGSNVPFGEGLLLTWVPCNCKWKISDNKKKSFVLLEHIWSQITLTWERSLKLANNLSADFVIKQNAQLLFLGKCPSVSVK